MGKYLIGIDLGTQSIRTHLYDEDANLVCSASQPHNVDTPKPNWITQKASTWWGIVTQNIKQIIAQSGVDPAEIAAIGCCAHMHGSTAITADRKTVVDDTPLYSDRRTADISRELKSRENYAQMFEIAGNPPAPSWFGLKIAWIKQNMPEVYERAYKFVTPKDYINYKLTGAACIDPSEASGAYLMDRKTDKWSDTLIKNLGIDAEKLPEIKQSSEIVGYVCAEAAAETGLSERTAVVCGGGDMLCLLYTSGLTQKGTVVDINGTGSVVCYYTNEPIMDDRIMNLRHVIPGWVPFGNNDSSGAAFRWLRDNLAKDEVKYARQNGMDEYDYLCKLAAQTKPGADGLLFMPYMAGERTLGSQHSKGSYVGISHSTTVGHLVRAMLEGVALEFRRTFEIFESSGANIERVFHVSGGSKGSFWNQVKADVYGLPLYTLKVDEGGVLGAALLAGLATGIFGDAAQAAEAVLQIDREYLPNPQNNAFYKELYQVFCETHDSLQKPYIDLARFRD